MNKLKSRKFHVFLIWITFIGFSLFKDALTDTQVEYFGYVSLVYIGGNVAQKYFSNGNNLR